MRTFFNYLFAIFFLISAIGATVEYVAAAPFFLIAALFALPFTMKLIEKYTVTFQRTGKIIVIAVFGIIGFAIIGSKGEVKAKLKEQQDSLAEVEAFNKLPQSVKDSINNEKKARREEAIRERERERIKAHFSDVTGENYDLGYYIKQNLHDPESYEHVKTSWVQMDTVVLVYTTIRAKNGFGAKRLVSYEAGMSFDNQLLYIKELKE